MSNKDNQIRRRGEDIKSYICWVNYGCEGYQPHDYETVEEAVKHESYGSEKIITKLVKYDIKERGE